ncbi:MAG: helix-turn-helix domain-containing protein [Planctomycetota bacterium]
MAKSKSGEFYSFDEVLRQLSIDENRLKRLVSEGEIRAFREGGQMKFKRSEIDNLAGRGGRSGTTSETSLTEISLEDDDSQPTVNVGAGVGDTLGDDLLAEPDLTATGGMRTAEISSQDTFIDQGDVGMSTEPIDFTEDADLGEEDEVEDIGASRRGGAARAPQQQQRRVVVAEEARTPALMVICLLLAALIGVYASLVTANAWTQKGSNGITEWSSTTFGPEDHPKKAAKGGGGS